jgi:DDB1- and CUL4-associated factor 13
VPEQLRLQETIPNPALPPRRPTIVPSPGPYITETRGIGSKRIYLDIQSAPENVAYPPRPVPGSVADLDVVMDHCDFSEKKVRSLREPLASQFSFSLVCAGLLGGIAGRRRFG